MNITTWTPEAKALLIRLANDGKTAAEAGAALGFTRSAILGQARRMGVRFPLTAEKVERISQGRRKPRTLRPKRLGPSRRGRPKGDRAYSDARIAAALAARMAGLSRAKAAAIIGASKESIWVWEKKPELVAAGEALYRQAYEQAARVRALRDDADRRFAEQRATRNSAALGRLPTRIADVTRRYLAGEPAADIAARLGVSRERVYQILGQAGRAGVDFAGRLRRVAKAA